MLDQAGELHEALVALLNKLDVVEKAISGVFVLAHVHGMPYSGPNYNEEYDRGRELPGTTRSEVLDEPPPENPAMDPILVPADRVAIRGRVVGVIRSL